MKLHLPRTLLATLLACFALHAQGETTYPTYTIQDFIAKGSPADSNLTVSYQRDSMVDWNAEQASTLSLNGIGDTPQLESSTLNMSSTRADRTEFVIEGVRLADCTLTAGSQADAVLNGSVSIAFSKCALLVENGGSITVQDDNTASEVTALTFKGGSINGNFKGSHGLGVRVDYSPGVLDYGSDGGSAVLNGNLGGDRRRPSITFGFGRSEQDSSLTCTPLTVNGEVSGGGSGGVIAGGSRLSIICTPMDSDSEWGDTFASPVLLLTCSSYTADETILTIEADSQGKKPANIDKLQAFTLDWQESKELYVGDPNSGKRPETGGDNALNVPSPSGPPGFFTLDSTEFSTVTINGNNVVVIPSGREVTVNGDAHIGGGSGKDHSSLNVLPGGEFCVAKAITIDNATLGNGGLVRAEIITVKKDSWLKNNGTLDSAVTVEGGGTLSGEGTFSGRVYFEKAGNYNTWPTHRHGNSPGYNEFQAGLSYAGKVTTIFTVDGLTASSFGSEKAGHHSYGHVSGGQLTLGDTVNTTVEVTSGMASAGGGTPFALTLLDVAGGGANVAGNGTFELTTLDDPDKLLSHAKLVWDKDNGRLLLHGMVDPAKAAPRMNENGVAMVNSLWSSTSAVRAFARNAASQLTSPAQVGKVTVWGSALGDYVTMSGLRSNAHGYAVGADKQFCPHVRAGIALGQMYGDYTADRGLAEVEQHSAMFSLYGEYRREFSKRHGISLTGYAAYGRVDNDADTHLAGSANLPAGSSWDDDVFSVGFRAHWNMKVADKWTLSPFIGLEYLRGDQSRYTESWLGGSREYWGGAMQVWSLPVGITASTEVDLGGGQKLLPWLTVGYVGDVSREDPHGSSRVYGYTSRHEGTEPGRHGFMLNAGANWQINESWSAGASYNFETRSHETSHEGNFSVRYAF